MENKTEFEEIAHTGGKVKFNIEIDAEGSIFYNTEWTHSRPTPAAMFEVYAIPQGFAVGDCDLASPPPVPGCYQVFISSDSTGMFGHQCPSCKGYWRANAGGRICPYCAFKSNQKYHFLTDAQKRYVKQYCMVLNLALASQKKGEHIIDMDSVAEAAGKDCKKPYFFYAEEKQQNLFTCKVCGEINDVLGTFVYCSSCGTRNDLAEQEKIIQGIRNKINTAGPYEIYVKEAVAAFDSLAGQYAKQLLARIPLTQARKTRIENSHFHDLSKASELFRNIFDINILRGISDEDIAFAKLMFQRRHVYEHKGGEADEKYIEDSGDKVRLKQALRETQVSAHRIANVVIRISTNLHNGFHEIFPPLERLNQRRR